MESAVLCSDRLGSAMTADERRDVVAASIIAALEASVRDSPRQPNEVRIEDVAHFFQQPGGRAVARVLAESVIEDLEAIPRHPDR